MTSPVAGHRRAICALAAVCLLGIALVRIPGVAGGQAAVSLSREGQEDLTFWVHRRGLAGLDFEGEVGFGDLARVLMRRRANAPSLRAIRDRFVFRDKTLAALETPDLFRAEVRGGELRWLQLPAEPLVVTAGRVFNLPVAVFDRDRGEERAFLLRGTEEAPGLIEREFRLPAADRDWRLRVRLDVRPAGRLRVRLEEGGAPVAARVYLTGADGLAYVPEGSITRYAPLPAEVYFHAQGEFTVELPAGETTVEATRGLEYETAAAKVMIGPGQTRELTLKLRRWTHRKRDGWYSADAHIHANYTAEHHQVITAEDMRLLTLGEDLNLANLMVANSSGAYLHDTQFFEGRPHRLSQPGYLLDWNEEMRNSGLYGHMCFFHLKHLVEPLYTGFRDTPHWEDYPPNYTQAKAARAQGGAVTYAHPGYAATFEGASARELPVDLALGEVDAMDVLSNNPEEVATELWYRLLNTGFRLGISAGTDAFTNVADHYIPGGGRVYAQVKGPLTVEAWTESFRQGRTFATNGPMIDFTVDGRGPGEELGIAGPGPREVEVRARVETRVPVEQIEIVVNGKPAVTRRMTGQTASFRERIRLERSSWLALRVTGPWSRGVLNDTAAFAHTSPVWVLLDHHPVRSAEDAQYWVEWIDKLIARVEERGRFATPERRQEVIALFRRAQQIYRERAVPGTLGTPTGN